jgi:hypothetical protein
VAISRIWSPHLAYSFPFRFNRAMVQSWTPPTQHFRATSPLEFRCQCVKIAAGHLQKPAPNSPTDEAGDWRLPSFNPSLPLYRYRQLSFPRTTSCVQVTGSTKRLWPLDLSRRFDLPARGFGVDLRREQLQVPVDHNSTTPLRLLSSAHLYGLSEKTHTWQANPKTTHPAQVISRPHPQSPETSI